MEYWQILIIATVGPLLVWRLREPLTKRRNLKYILSLKK